MSKAFTKEDDDAGFSKPPSSSMLAVGPFRLTAYGAEILRTRADERVQQALALAEIVPPIAEPEQALLGVVVRVRDDDDREHEYRLVSAGERALLGEGCSVEGPLGRALLGARVGDTREVTLPSTRSADGALTRGPTELEVIALESR